MEFQCDCMSQFQPGDQVRFIEAAIRLNREATVYATGTVVEVEPAVELFTANFDSEQPMLYPARFLDKVVEP